MFCPSFLRQMSLSILVIPSIRRCQFSSYYEDNSTKSYTSPAARSDNWQFVTFFLFHTFSHVGFRILVSLTIVYVTTLNVYPVYRLYFMQIYRSRSTCRSIFPVLFGYTLCKFIDLGQLAGLYFQFCSWLISSSQFV